MSKAMIMTVGTGRDREDIAGAIFFSIRRHKPQFISFVLSEQSNAETFPIVESGLDMEYETNLVEEVNDVETLFLEYRVIVSRVKKRGFAAKDIVADYTSGTKAMSSALFSAAIAEGIGSISYTHGQRDKTGRVIPGKEQIKSFSPMRIVADRDLARAKQFFDLNRFESCTLVCEDLRASAIDKSLREEADFLSQLSKAYDYWDRFEHDLALRTFQKISKTAFLGTYNLTAGAARQAAFLEYAAKNFYCYERVIDLAENARRRFEEEGRYDDGLARLYRGFEYLAQVRLYQAHGSIESKNLTLEQIPSKLKWKYDKKKNEKGFIQLPLVGCYEVLEALDDMLGIRFMQDYRSDKKFNEALNKRNNSILAHGFIPIDKVSAIRLLDYFEVYIKMCYTKYEKKRLSCIFPKLLTK